ncbi:MAG: hypothetical protein IJ197_06895 [Bacteroidaceae bacterium]|nr:hypothetical protein [Bacteroidaceae bacterium]
MKKQYLLLYIAALLLLPACTGESRRMQALLEQAEEMNRTDQPFLSDSIGKALVRHYDHWWHSRNLRMRAYYMLGCAYRDMGEAPAAIHYYNIAAEQADTTSKKCDYATLFRVYGQMAMIYGQQNMPQEELSAWDAYSKYALLSGDTLNNIYGYAMKGGPYYVLNDTMMVVHIANNAHEMYLKHGYVKQASDVYHNIIYIYLKNRKNEDAKPLMDSFEKESGVFDKDGNIESGRELYYSFKGLYYLGTNKIDSAEYFYRKLSTTDYHYEANKGLFAIYQQKQNVDSVIKYASTTIDALIQWETKRQANAVIQSSAMYKYERNQNAAIRSAQRAERYKVCSLFILLLVFFLFRHYRKRIKQEKEKLQLLNQQYLDATREHELLVEEFQILKRNYNNSDKNAETMALMEKKQQHIAQLEKNLKKYQSELNLLSYKKREELLTRNEVITYFNNKKDITPNWEVPRPEKWKSLMDVYAKYMPHVVAKMDKAELSKQERLVTILTYLKVNPSVIAHLLGTSCSRVSNAKKNVCRKLFAEEDSRKLRERLIDLECENEVKILYISENK